MSKEVEFNNNVECPVEPNGSTQGAAAEAFNSGGSSSARKPGHIIQNKNSNMYD